MRHPVARGKRGSRLLGLAALVACARPSPPAPPAVAPPPAGPEIVVQAPAAISRSAPAPTSASASAPAAPAAPPSTPLACVAPFDPELDRESPWSREVGGRLARALERLGHCASDLPSEEPAEVTLRFVYAQDGTPVSSHVVSASSAACPLVSCLEPALREVRAPKLLIERGSYDLAIALKRGQAPERVAPPGDGLVTAAAAEEGGCVDPAVAALSRERVDEVVASTFDGLKACYGQALARDHHASGHVAFEFVIGQQGSVNLAQAREATLYDCAAIDCMLAEFRRLSFPAPVGRSVRVIYPVRFSVEQPPVQLR